MMSSRDYRAKAEILIMQANASTRQADALELIGMAAQWRKLADVADWQEAVMRHIAEAGEPPLPPPTKP